MSETVLSIQGLHAGYGRAEVLSGIDLSAPKGSIITVIGPNGAGKSTFLNALMGVLPSRGAVHFSGQDLAETTLEDRVMMGLALVPEKRELFTTMPVEDNLLLGGYRAMRLGQLRIVGVPGGEALGGAAPAEAPDQGGQATHQPATR